MVSDNIIAIIITSQKKPYHQENWKMGMHDNVMMLPITYMTRKHKDFDGLGIGGEGWQTGNMGLVWYFSFQQRNEHI